MNAKDKKDEYSRAGSGRCGIYKATGLVHCYTLECNYATGRRVNRLSQRVDKATGEMIPDTDPILDSTCPLYPGGKPPIYTVPIFKDIGNAFCLGLLDFYEINPKSRIPSSRYKNLSSIKGEICAIYDLKVDGVKNTPKHRLPTDLLKNLSKKGRKGLMKKKPPVRLRKLRSQITENKTTITKQNSSKVIRSAKINN